MSHLIVHFKNIIKFVLKKLFSLYFCFKSNGSLALPLKEKEKKKNGNLYSSIRTKKIKVGESRDEGIKVNRLDEGIRKKVKGILV